MKVDPQESTPRIRSKKGQNAYFTLYVPHAIKSEVDKALKTAQDGLRESRAVVVCRALEVGLPLICSGVTGLSGWGERNNTRRNYGF